ncbi:PspC domain-containing protein, partial [bacterium]|nr:PspC domain-containing protein [bacterium]
MKRLFRSRNNKIIAGVCGGVGEYFNIDPVLVRLIWGILFFIGGAGLLGYIIAWIIIPERIDMPGTAMDSEEEKHVQMKTSYTPQLLIGLFLVFIGATLLIRDW